MPSKIVSNTKNLVEELIATRSFSLRRFDAWSPELDEALLHLPESDILPRELFCSLMATPGPVKKQIILVKCQGEPVALAGLKNRWGTWEPVTQWIIPGVLFPMREKFLSKILASLDIPMHIGWWRWDTPPPNNAWIRNITSVPTYGMDCATDHEQYWRETGFFKSVRLFRNRCHGFAFHVDLPGTREWTIKSWEAKWRREGIDETPDLIDRLVASDFLEKRGLYHTATLLDGDKIVAGITFLIHRNTAVAQVNYRDPQYDKHGVMSRLWDLCFPWAKEKGFSKIDIGGSFDYKEKLVPANGTKWEFDVLPSRVKLKQVLTFRS